MKKSVMFFILIGLCGTLNSFSQSNEFVSNPVAKEILLGAYDPALYVAAEIIDAEEDVLSGLVENASSDNLLDLLSFLDTFYNRNTGSDTSSFDTGIGACRDWILSYFNLISRENNNRLVTGFLEFDADVCGMGHHKNPFAILPGRDTTIKEILVIEGHFDTRNEDGCDTQGYTPGSDDNGSGTVLVMEAARILSKYTFDRTILFTTPTGEDQGLWGAKAWANYLSDNDIEVMACLNNDVVGGITCGKTSSPPSCPYEGHVDSTHVRVFSYSPGNSPRNYSPHKQLARLIKLIQEERINPYLETPMTINIMGPEDRSGRSGDHIPFRQKGYTAIRFCSANENGNGRGDYPDRQHSTRDVLGLDENEDGGLDTLFVNPNYLQRNTLINSVMLANLANSPKEPTYSYFPVNSGVRIEVDNLSEDITAFRIGVRYTANRSNEFDEIQMVVAKEAFEIKIDPSSRAFISVAPIRSGFYGMFSEEYELDLMGSDPFESASGCRIESVYPNPASGKLNIELIHGSSRTAEYSVQLADLSGKVIREEQLSAAGYGQSEHAIDISNLTTGIYLVRLRNENGFSKPVRFVKNSTI